MLPQNKQYAQTYNLINWHERGYTGRDIRVALFDEGAFLRDGMESYCTIPFPTDDTKPTHSTNVAAVLHEFAPDAEIFMLPLLGSSDTERLQYAKWIADPANRIDLISTSCIVAGSDNAEYWQVLENSGIPMFCAAGNGSDEKGYTDNYAPATLKWTYAIGGIAPALDKKVQYSNYGEFLTCMAYTSPYILSTSNVAISLSGTSFCQPQACAVVACLLQAAKELGFTYTRESLLSFIAANCKDYYETGKDNMSGYGLLVLPDIEKYLEDNAMKIEMWVGNKNAFIDGEPATMSMPPKIDNGSTLVPIRFVSEALGCKVDYDSKSKKITITR